MKKSWWDGRRVARRLPAQVRRDYAWGERELDSFLDWRSGTFFREDDDWLWLASGAFFTGLLGEIGKELRK